jgi:hypothetical protein
MLAVSPVGNGETQEASPPFNRVRAKPAKLASAVRWKRARSLYLPEGLGMWRAKRVRGLKALHAPSKTWETISAGKNTGERESSDEAGSVLSAFLSCLEQPQKRPPPANDLSASS